MNLAAVKCEMERKSCENAELKKLIEHNQSATAKQLTGLVGEIRGLVNLVTAKEGLLGTLSTENRVLFETLTIVKQELSDVKQSHIEFVDKANDKFDKLSEKHTALKRENVELGVKLAQLTTSFVDRSKKQDHINAKRRESTTFRCG